MNDTRWQQMPTPEPNGLWPDLSGKRYRVTVGPDMFPEQLEVAVPRLPEAPGWYRLPDRFGAVFRRDDGAWLDANGSLVAEASLPDGLIPLVDGSTTEDES